MPDRILDLRRVPAREPIPNPKNWRRHPEAQRRALRAMLDDIGYADVLLARETPAGLELIDGHLRAEATPDAEVPVLVLDVNEEEAAKLLASLDPLGAMAEADSEALAALLESVTLPEDLLAALGVQTSANGRTDPDEAPPVPKKARTQLGDLWTLGAHRLLCGDAADEPEMRRLVGGDAAQLVMADPPYNVNYRGGSSRKSRVRSDAYPDQFADYGGWLGAILVVAYALSDEEAPLLLWHSTSQLRAVLTALDAARWHDRSMIVWNKGSIKGGLGQSTKQYRTQFEPLFYCHKRGRTPRWHGPGNESDLWDEPSPRASPLHPTMKPVVLYERSLRNHSDIGAIVLECFGGSGTTIIACETQARRARVAEIEPAYCDVAVTRWEEFTGQKAERIRG